MRLPEEFITQMQSELGSGQAAFLAEYARAAWHGIRLNQRKVKQIRPVAGSMEKPDETSLRGVGPWKKSRPVPWCFGGYCFDREDWDNPGRDPFHLAGAWYIQEPSAMLPAELLDARPGERVLDLCAAPGGKSTQLIDRMEDRGLLVANDISASRGQAVVKNLERFGVGQILVTAVAPERLVGYFSGYFDKILVDAPCSGEGMFRREPSMCREWQERGPAWYVPLQREILTQAVRMLRPGGRLVYSTCTFNRQEDEENAAWLTHSRKDLRLLREEKLWPHLCHGEGQYAALLEKQGEERPDSPPQISGNFTEKGNETVTDFFRLISGISWRTDRWFIQNDQLYEWPEEAGPWQKLRFLRTGLHLGEIRRGRFEPSQALAMYLSGEQFANTVEFALEDERVLRYLKGETVDASYALRRGGDGWCLVLMAGLPLGWAKRSKDTLKNKYAPGWRLQ